MYLRYHIAFQKCSVLQQIFEHLGHDIRPDFLNEGNECSLQTFQKNIP